MNERVSVIIPTYNGKHKIAGILEALKRQSYKPFEVILVIDGSSDGTAESFRNYKADIYTFRVVEQENKGRAAVRNRGAKEATGDLLVFFDDDMLPLENCVNGHVTHHTEHPGSILTGGLGEEANGDSSEILKFKSYLSSKWTGALHKDENGRLLKQSIFITAANFSISKKVFTELGGFDERLKDAEDFDLAVRAYKAGIPLYFKQQVFAWHNEAVTTVSFIKRQRAYTQAHRTLIGFSPWLKEEGFLKTVIAPTGWRKRIFNFFGSYTWIKAIDQNRLKFLPRKIRYKLYDIVITANGVYFPNKVSLD